MSVSPVQAILPGEVQFPDVAHHGGGPDTTAPDVSVELHAQSSSQSSDSQPFASSARPPVDTEEIEVQRDSEDSNQIVVRYIDQTTGNLVLQVPSNQVLDVARGIHEELQHEVQLREEAPLDKSGKG